jgi:purine-cytosine permease-like protein
MPPLGRPTAAVLLGWLGIGWAVLVVLAAAFGARFPTWVGWVAVVGFLAGFGVLISRLPRNRPPDAGDGAVL